MGRHGLGVSRGASSWLEQVAGRTRKSKRNNGQFFFSSSSSYFIMIIVGFSRSMFLWGSGT